MSTAAEMALLDRNVLVYAAMADAQYHARCEALLARGWDEEAGLCVVPQVLIEFFAVVTNPKRVSNPRTPTEALEAIDTLREMPGCHLLETPRDLVHRWTSMVRTRPVLGRGVFDVQLAAAMLSLGVRRLYTFNGRHFSGISWLEVLVP